MNLERQLTGKAHVYGDNINTDVIIPGKYTKTLDLGTLAEHVLEDLDPLFRQNLKAGDILVAGKNFGCGSSREQAPLALKTAGVSAVVSIYFARIFYRNAINVGLPVFEVADHRIVTGDLICIDLQSGIITNKTRELTYQSHPMPEMMIKILNDGGLVNHMKRHGGYSPY